MKTIYRYISMGFAAAMLVGCSEIFPTILEDVGDGQVHPYDKNPDSVPILPTLTDPLYDIIVTRGAGAFDHWATDSARWVNSDFHVFALLTGKNQEVDYLRTDTLQRLLFDENAYLQNEQGDMLFQDEQGETKYHYYLKSHPENQYKFFAYHADDALVSDYQISNTQIQADVVLDGTQDLVHAFAYPTQQQRELSMAALGSGYKSLLYTYKSGFAGLHPILHVNHMLASFDILITGRKMGGRDYNYHFVTLDSVTVMAPNRCRLTIADDAWNETSYQLALNRQQVAQFADELVPYKRPVTSRPMTNTESTLIHNSGVNFDDIRTQLIDRGFYSPDDTYYHINGDTTVVDTLCSPMLLPPMNEVQLCLRGNFLQLDALHQLASVVPIKQDAPLVIKNPDGAPFLPGHHYSIIIKAYGLNRIQIGAIVHTWVEAGTVYMDTHNLIPDGYYEDEEGNLVPID